ARPLAVGAIVVALTRLGAVAAAELDVDHAALATRAIRVRIALLAGRGRAEAARESGATTRRATGLELVLVAGEPGEVVERCGVAETHAVADAAVARGGVEEDLAVEKGWLELVVGDATRDARHRLPEHQGYALGRLHARPVAAAVGVHLTRG